MESSSQDYTELLNKMTDFDLQSFINDIFCKSPLKSVELRQDGNVLFRKKNRNSAVNYAILLAYCKSIAYSLPNSEEQIASYTNRAAFMMDQKEYNNALIDIERAFKIDANPEKKAKLLIWKAKCFKLLGKSSNAKTSIDQAVEAINIVSNYETKEKLLKQLNDIEKLKKYSNSSINEVVFNLPTLKENREVPCASDAVKINYDKKYGRHLIATRKIVPGEILIIEDAYFRFPNLELHRIICSHCLKLAVTSLPCDYCSFVVFCSEECKKIAWTQYHDIECSVLPSLYSDKNFDPALLLRSLYDLRLFIKAVKEEGIPGILNVIKQIDQCKNERTKGFSEDNKFGSDKFGSVYSLNSIDKLTDPEILKKQFIKMMDILKSNKSKIFRTIEKDSEIYNGLKNLYVKLSNISYINGYNVSINHQELNCFCEDDSSHESSCVNFKGGYLAPFCALLNHSCHANVNHFYTNGKIIVYCCRPISEGDQLFKSYGPNISYPKCERHEKLDRYNFVCDCEVCDGDWPEITNERIEQDTDALVSTISKDPSLRIYLREFQLLQSSMSPKDKSKRRLEMAKSLYTMIDLGYTHLSQEKAIYSTFSFKHILQRIFQGLYFSEYKVKRN